MEWVD